MADRAKITDLWGEPGRDDGRGGGFRAAADGRDAVAGGVRRAHVLYLGHHGDAQGLLAQPRGPGPDRRHYALPTGVRRLGPGIRALPDVPHGVDSADVGPDYSPGSFAGVRTVFTAALRAMQRRMPHSTMVNTYGMTEEEVIAHCRAGLASFKVPRHVRFVTEGPMFSTKVQTFRLREQLEAELTGRRMP
jgi:acyl-CoA synthetase (AMP-forming)/AMP-acid ligase II